MTHERDRIQENANKYIVKNCPCNVTTKDMCDWENTNETYCQDCTDCVIKQVIEKCNSRKGTIMENFAEQILDMFDIEEISK